MSSARVLVVGELNPDLVLHGDVVPRFGQAEQLLHSAVWTIGGSAAITAHAFARLDRPVSLVAAVGMDGFGTQLRDDLADAGVDVGSVAVRDDAPTGLTVALCDVDDRAILTLLGAAATLTCDEALDALHSHPDVCHLHIAAPFLVQLAGRHRELLDAAADRGVTVSLDTNDDPSGRWLGIEALLDQVDVFLPNRAEVLALGGGGTDVDAAARQVAARGPLVVVKDGAAGAIAVADGKQTVRVGAPEVIAVDTTGAGDTFDAAFVDAWLAGMPLPRSLDRAVRAGALAVSAVGGTSAQPTQADLDTPGAHHDH